MFHRHLQNIRFLQFGLVQPERSDHGFFELIQTVVYPLPPLSLNERLSELQMVAGHPLLSGLREMVRLTLSCSMAPYRLSSGRTGFTVTCHDKYF